MRALPVDYRSCREDACAEGAESGPVSESLDGEPVTAFVHVVDCRDGAAAREGYDCTGDRVGRLYLQYWLYYPGSATARALLGDAGAHPDDWETFQVRIGPDGAVDARASSHHGYNGDSGDWLSDSGLVEKAGWTASTGPLLHLGWQPRRPGRRPGGSRARPPWRGDAARALDGAEGDQARPDRGARGRRVGVRGLAAVGKAGLSRPGAHGDGLTQLSRPSRSSSHSAWVRRRSIG